MAVVTPHPGMGPACRIAMAVQVIVLYVLPMLLFVTDVVPVVWRYGLFGVGMTIPLFEMLLRRWSPRRIGFRVDNLASGLLPYAAFTATLTVGLLLLARLLGKVPTGHPLARWDLSLILSTILLSFLQEVCFRGYLRIKLDAVFASTGLQVLANALLFAWLHVIYPDPFFSMAITFIAGLGFATMFHFYPNLWLIAGSHAVLNCVSTLYCFLSLTGACTG